MLKKIEEIAEAKGNDKIEVLKKYPELKELLQYAYDPFKKYYMTAPIVFGCENGIEFGINEFTLLDDLQTRSITGHKAVGRVKTAIMSLDFDSTEIFKRVLNKDLRAGISVNTINKAWPGLIPLVFDGSTKPDIMLLKTYDQKKARFPILAAVKKDGVRARYINGQLVSRQGQKFIGLDHIEKELENFDCEFDGELCVPGEIFDVASGLIRNFNPTPNAVYQIFDMPSYPGNKLNRHINLCKCLKSTEHIRIISHYKIKSKESLNKFYNKALADGEEGIVVYDPYSMYEDKRSFDWMRLVPLKTSDCEVIGFYEGKGKHHGSLGGIIVNYKGHKVKVGTGFKEKVQLKQIVSESDKALFYSKSKEVSSSKIQRFNPLWQNIRQFIWDNQKYFLGAIAECEFKEETKSGSMRQPRFKRWRWDK